MIQFPDKKRPCLVLISFTSCLPSPFTYVICRKILIRASRSRCRTPSPVNNRIISFKCQIFQVVPVSNVQVPPTFAESSVGSWELGWVPVFGLPVHCLPATDVQFSTYESLIAYLYGQD